MDWFSPGRFILSLRISQAPALEMELSSDSARAACRLKAHWCALHVLPKRKRFPKKPVVRESGWKWCHLKERNFYRRVRLNEMQILDMIATVLWYSMIFPMIGMLLSNSYVWLQKKSWPLLINLRLLNELASGDTLLFHNIVSLPNDLLKKVRYHIFK